jgi:hypothetical protein
MVLLTQDDSSKPVRLKNLKEEDRYEKKSCE